jgi:hypothetical protein
LTVFDGSNRAVAKVIQIIPGTGWKATLTTKVVLALAVATAAIFGVMVAKATACEEDTLDTVSDGGDILIMVSGKVYQVDSGDDVDSQLWLAAEDVIICGNTIINKNENGEKVSAVRIR